MKRFLITGVGGDVAQSVCRVLRSIPDVQIFGCDVSSRNAGKLFVDEFSVVPSAFSDGYIEAVAELIGKHSIECIVPMSEAEIDVLVNHGPRVNGCHVVSPGRLAVNTCLDKYSTAEFLRSAGIETPWTVVASDGYPLEYPCIFKSRKGSGSKTVYIVNGLAEADYLRQKYKECVFQELLGPANAEITCGVFRTGSGRTSCIQLQRSLSGGATGWCKVIGNLAIDTLCHEVACLLDLKGSLNIQMILTEQGPRIFEINPRFSSTVEMRHELGFTDVLWTIDDILEQPISFSEVRIGSEMVRVNSVRKLN